MVGVPGGDAPWSRTAWEPVISASHFDGADDLPNGISATIKRGDTQLAVWRIRGRYYATQQMCPHKRAFVLSDGLIGDDYKTDKLWISCPYHKRNYELKGDNAGKCVNDEQVNIATFPVEAREDGLVYVKLPPVEELDGVLGTEKWKIRAEETEEPEVMAKVEQKNKGLKGRKAMGASHLPNGLGEKGKAQAILAGGERGANGMDW